MIHIETLDHRVDKELNALPNSLKAKLVHIVELINEYGLHEIGMPHIRYLEKGLWEMRLKSNDGIARAIYVTQQHDKIIILHVFVKKTQKTPRNAIDTALKRLKELEK